jgi:hypothetical protein
MTLGLSRYHHINDRQILFDTGLDVNQLERGKKELTDIKWCFFYEDWVYHNHNSAYVDYKGRDLVMLAKDKELNSISPKIQDYFQGVVKGLETPYNHNYNHNQYHNNNHSNNTEKININGNEDLKRLQDFKSKAFKNIGKPVLSILLALFLFTKPVAAYTIKLKYHINSPKSTIRSHKFSSPTPTPLPDGTREKPAPDGLENKNLIILSRDEAEGYARKLARQYKINEEAVVCTFIQESGFLSRRPDGSLKCGDGGASCGTGQIQLPTWKSMRKHAGWTTEDLRGNDVENIKTTVYGLATLWKYHWTGYRTCESMGLKI